MTECLILTEQFQKDVLNNKSAELQSWLAETVPRTSNYLIAMEYDKKDQCYRGQVIEVYRNQVPSITILANHAALRDVNAR